MGTCADSKEEIADGSQHFNAEFGVLFDVQGREDGLNERKTGVG